MTNWTRRYIPSALTLGNLYLGLLSIALVMNGDVRNGAFLVLFGMFFDGLDGKLARLLDVTSNFGKELDSLADVITFGIAPAVLLLSFAWINPLYQVAAAVFVSAGAIRLARFNTQSVAAASHFVGLPITAGGGIAATAVLYADKLPQLFLPLAYVVLAALMLSTLPYPSFKSVSLPRNNLVLVGSIMATLAFLWLARDWAFVPLLAYALFGLGYRGGLWRRLPHGWRVRYEKRRNYRLERRQARKDRRAK
jgi:CDP-diacylglycerol--serine O-phosphatidyltransferase